MQVHFCVPWIKGSKKHAYCFAKRKEKKDVTPADESEKNLIL
jgi:hypothetical protein